VALFQADNGMYPGPGDKALPGEEASRELLMILYGPDPTPVPTAVPTPTPAPVTQTDLK